jgi:hypothetical protein
MVLCLLSRHSTTRATLPAHFCCGYFGNRVSGQLGPWSSYFMLPAVAGMTGAQNYPQLFSIKMGSFKLLAQAGLDLRSVILPTLASGIAEMVCMHHHTQSSVHMESYELFA